MPYVPAISKEISSYWHIEAQLCGRINTFSHANLADILKDRYAGVLGKGFDFAKLNLPDEKKKALHLFMAPGILDPKRWQPDAINRGAFLKRAEYSGLNEKELTNVWDAFAATLYDEEGIIELIEPTVASVRTLFDLWKDTPLKSLELNSTGIAIGHAYASHHTSFNAPLNIWIK